MDSLEVEKEMGIRMATEYVNTEVASYGQNKTQQLPLLRKHFCLMGSAIRLQLKYLTNQKNNRFMKSVEH